MTEKVLDWNEVVSKEARGIDNIDLGQVKAVGQLNIMTQKGSLIKETYYFPKYLVKDFNGQIIWVNVSQDQLKGFEKERPPIREDYTKYQSKDRPAGAEAVIPVLEERLQVSKTSVTEEVIIVKEPVTEYKLIHVPIVREEIRIIRRPAGGGGTPASTGESPSPADAPSNKDDKEIRILLNREEVQITKKPYLFEEVIIRKESVTDAKELSVTVTKERIIADDKGEKSGII